jgi:prephenate dehydratase
MYHYRDCCLAKSGTHAVNGTGEPTRPVAYAGEPGAFAEDAVLAAFGDVERVAVGSFREVFEWVARGEARSGVVPIENSVNGTVREVYDLLLEHELEIVGETVVPVELCLAALPGATVDGIERVYSHIQALGQAERYLRGRDWMLLTTYNTAGAGKLISESHDARSAAVLSARAAERFGLDVLARAIQDVADNRTRFLTIDREPAGQAIAPSGSYRTTLAFAVRNEPGALLAALRCFAGHDINLSSLESRPSREVAWEYVFWADVDAHATDPQLAAALEELRSVATLVRVLGTYPRAAATS